MASNLKKYLAIISVYWQRNLVYRTTIVAYRIGEVIEQLALIVLWTAIYGSQQVVSGFTLNEMITYIAFGNFFNVLTRNFIARIVAIDIKDGKLSGYLMRPMSYFDFMFTRTIGGHSYAALLSALSELVIIALFYAKIQFNTDILAIVVIIVMILLAIVTEFLLNFLIGTIAFWTDEVDGIHDAILSLKRIVAGGLFPLSLLPKVFVTASYALPFAYTFFVPMQIYLKKIDLNQGLRGLGIQCLWIIVLYIIVRIVWERGLRRYEGTGI